MNDMRIRPPASEAGMLKLLRDAGPYLVSHRQKLFVILVRDTVNGKDNIRQLLADLMLLRHLTDARLVLAYDVFGPGEECHADDAEMAKVRAKSNMLRELIEQHLSHESSRSVPKVDIFSGNLVTARRKEEHLGGSQGWLGEHPKIDVDKAAKLTEAGILLLPPFGMSRQGEQLHVPGEDIACLAASRLLADKLIVFVSRRQSAWLDFKSLTVSGVDKWLANCDAQPPEHADRLLRMTAKSVSRGIKRAHFIDEEIDGGLLLELLLPEGIGAMVTNEPFEEVRPATKEDVKVIFELIADAVREDKLLPRSMEELHEQIDTFAVAAPDNYVVACASLSVHGTSAELRCLAVRPGHTELSWGEMLLGYFEDKARSMGIRRMLAVTTRARGWFVQHGYTAADFRELPGHRCESVAGPRHAKVLGKNLGL